jgi:hypothetical protein
MLNLLSGTRTVLAKSVELFQYRGAAKDVGTFEYVFESSEKQGLRHRKRSESG